MAVDLSDLELSTCGMTKEEHILVSNQVLYVCCDSELHKEFSFILMSCHRQTFWLRTLCGQYRSTLMQLADGSDLISSGVPQPDNRACTAAAQGLRIVYRERLSLYKGKLIPLSHRK